jgi:hypothetical protein
VQPEEEQQCQRSQIASRVEADEGFRAVTQQGRSGEACGAIPCGERTLVSVYSP